MNNTLKDAAQAVLDRWDSPQWEWSQQGPTADLMAALRQSLIATIEAQTTRPAECDYVSHVAYCRALEAYCDGMGHEFAPYKQRFIRLVEMECSLAPEDRIAYYIRNPHELDRLIKLDGIAKEKP